MKYNLQRFIDAQQYYYDTAKYELSQGKKEEHYMWFMFPQIKGLGHSPMAEYYAIADIDEARLYLKNPVLSEHLNNLLDILIDSPCDNAYQIFGMPDNMKLKSSMTLFKIADPNNERFDKVLQKFFKGEQDEYTIQILEMQNDLENTNNI